MHWSPVWAETSPAFAVWKLLEAGTSSVHLCAVGAGPSSGLSRLSENSRGSNLLLFFYEVSHLMKTDYKHFNFTATLAAALGTVVL